MIVLSVLVAGSLHGCGRLLREGWVRTNHQYCKNSSGGGPCRTSPFDKKHMPALSVGMRSHTAHAALLVLGLPLMEVSGLQHCPRIRKLAHVRRRRRKKGSSAEGEDFRKPCRPTQGKFKRFPPAPGQVG